jgi:phage terminase large subunit-like protein
MTNKNALEAMEQLDGEALEALIDAEPEAMLVVGAQIDSPDGFASYFELMEGVPLHAEGRRWIEKAYKAHAEGKGSAHEVHREGGKTTVFSKHFLSFRIGHEPEKTWGLIRLNDTKANETTKAIAQVIKDNPNWKLVFPTVVPDFGRGWGEKGYYVKDTQYSDDEWAEIVTRENPDPTFVGYGWESGSVVGSRFSGGVVVDDIHDRENTSSPTMLAKIKEWYAEVLEYCVMKDAWQIWNFTPWTHNDLYAHIKGTGEYVLSKTPVMREVSPDHPDAELWPEMPLNREHPELGTIPLSGKYYVRHWPEMWPWERLAEKYRKTKAIGFARQMLLDLEATKGITLKNEWLHVYPVRRQDKTWPIFFGIDYASTRDKVQASLDDLDYFSLSVGRAIPGGGLILIDGTMDRLSKGEALLRTQSFAGRYPTLMMIGVETISEGKEFYNDLVFTNDIFGYPLPLFPVKSHKGVARRKETRFEEWLAPKFQLGAMWITDEENPFINAFIDQWLNYPHGHDDALDSTYLMALAAEAYLVGKGNERTGGGPKKERKPNPYLSLTRS